MASKVPIPIFTDDKPYERFRVELMCWLDLNVLEKSKQGVAVALSLPEKHSSKIKDKVFDQISQQQLSSENGIDDLIALLDKHLATDDLSDVFEKFLNFEKYIRTNESVQEFVSEFDNKYQKLVKLGIELPQTILAFKLLNQSNLTQEEQMLVKSGIDYTEKETMYDQCIVSIKKFKGGANNEQSAAIKVEPAFTASSYNQGQRGSRRGRFQYRGNQRRNGNFGVFERGMHARKTNPLGANGRPLLCSACGSYRHLVKECPDSYENKKVDQVFDTESDETIYNVMLDKTEDTFVFTTEAMNSAVLDSACSSTVCGRAWLDSYIKSLTEEQRQEVKVSKSNRMFKFGGGTRLLSEGEYSLPAQLAGHKVMLTTDVVSSDIPLLLSKSAMKNAKMHINLEDDTAEVMGQKISLNCTSSGHYCIPILQEEIKVNNVSLAELSEKERKKTLLKLHLQFGHASAEKMILLLKDAKIWNSNYSTIINQIVTNCEICQRFKKTPSKSAVALPMARYFNDVVSLDLKKWEDGYILHIIDMWTRYSISIYIKNKQPQSVIDHLMKRWFSVFGKMKAILSDNGGEFSNEEMREIASILDLKLYTTAGYSPHQNGLNERIHGVIDLILHKLRAQYPKTDINVLIGWANMAKNSIHNHHGFSSHQLVFGTNPNLPNILTATPPSLEGKTMSQIFANHLNVLHSAREEFIKSEADERLRRALRHKISNIEQNFANGEYVYYKRDGKPMWLGPAKVIAQDGKVVFIRHGGNLIRMTPNRLMKTTNTKDNSSNQSQTNENSKNESRSTAELDSTDDDDENSEVNYEQQATDGAENLTLDENKISKNPVLEEADRNENNQYLEENENDENNKKEKSDQADLVPRRSLRVLNKEMNWNVHDAFVVQVPKSQQGNEDCMKAKNEELQKLKDFNVYSEEEFYGQKCISTRWVIVKKGERFKARLVARGFQEDQSEEIRVDSPTVGKAAMRICFAIAASNHWTLESTDIKSAFLQSDHVDRDIFVIPPKEAGTPGKVWKLNKCLYGLGDASRQFYMSLASELQRLGCMQSTVDHTVYFKEDSGILKGIILTHVDDFIHCGNSDFKQTVIEPLARRFVVGDQSETKFKYIGLSISQNDEFEISLHQNQYAATISQPKVLGDKSVELSSEEHTHFRAIVGALQWLIAGTRPDLCFETLIHSCKLKKAFKEDLNQCSRTVRRAKEEVQLIFPDLGPCNKWYLIVFTDASFANLPDKVSSCFAYIVLLIGADGRCCPISWKANKIKRVCRSTLAAETMALIEGLEECLYLKHLLCEIKVFNKENPIIAYTDNLGLKEALYSTKLVDDKQTRIDIAAIQEMLKSNKVQQINWVSTDRQLANALTKRGASTEFLLDVIQSGRILLQ